MSDAPTFTHPMMSFDLAAAYLGVSRSVLESLVEEHHIVAVRLPGGRRRKRYLRKADLDAFVETLQAVGT